MCVSDEEPFSFPDAFDDVKAPKNISKYSEETVCFYMFVDEGTESILKRERGLNGNKKVGIWRVVVVHNLPYLDGRRNGKVNYTHLLSFDGRNIRAREIIKATYKLIPWSLCRCRSFLSIGCFQMLAILYGLMENLSLSLIHIKFLKGKPYHIFIF